MIDQSQQGKFTAWIQSKYPGITVDFHSNALSGGNSPLSDSQLAEINKAVKTDYNESKPFTYSKTVVAGSTNH